MYCGKCGTENGDGIRFCTQCGADMAQQTPASTAATVEDTDALREDMLDAGRTPSNKGSRGSDSGDVPHAQAKMAAVGPLTVGRVVASRYKIVGRLGVGGMGEVFKAQDSELNDMEVAIKVLPPLLASNARSISRLRTEAAIALKLTHPSICRLHTFRIDGDLKFLVMEYIKGKTLEEMLEEDPTRKMKLEDLLPIAANIADALDFAHHLKPPILHRDIKPSNIMVDPTGRGKVLDFGIARELKDSMTRLTGKDTSGTLLYMSPEQFTGGTPTTASDVYSFAAMIYECLAGHAPFWQGSIAHQLLNQAPGEVPGLAKHVNDGLIAGLAKNGADRPATARELVRILEGKPSGGPVSTVSTATAQPSVGKVKLKADRVKTPKRGDVVVGHGKSHFKLRVFALLSLVLVAVAGAGVWQQWWPQSVLSLFESGGDDVIVVAATVDDVVAMKEKAVLASEQIKNVQSGPKISRMVSAVDILLGDAQEAAKQKEYADALKTYEEVLVRCDAVMKVDRERTMASKLRGDTSTAKIAAQKANAASLATEYWDRGEKLLADGGDAFVAGNFSEAAQSWQDAVHQYDRSRTRAVYSVEVGVAKAEYEKTLAQALEKVSSAEFDEHGGTDWQEAKAAVGAAETAGLSQEGADKWKEATVSLDKAWRVALADKIKFRSISDAMAEAVTALDAGKTDAAAAAVKRALVEKADYSPALVLEQTIKGTKALAAADAIALEKSFEALAEVRKALVYLDAALKIAPGDSRAAGLKRRGEQMVGALSGLFRFERELSAKVTSLAFLPGSRQILSGSEADGVKVWDLASGKHVRTLDTSADVSAIALSPDGATLIWAAGSKAKILSLAGQASSPVRLEGHVLAVLSVAIDPTGAYLATGSGDNTAKIWSAETRKCMAVLEHSGDVSGVAFSPVDGKLLATGSEDRHLRFWNVPDGKLKKDLTGHVGRILGLAFSPDGKLLAVGDDDKVVRIWDVSSGKCVKVLTGHERGVSGMAFSPDGKWLASSGGDKTVRLWDVRTGKNIQVLRGHKAWVRTVAFSADGKRMASCDDDNVAIVWVTGAALKNPPSSAASKSQ